MTSDIEKQGDASLPTAITSEHRPIDEHSSDGRSSEKAEKKDETPTDSEENEKKGSFKDFLVREWWDSSYIAILIRETAHIPLH